MSARQTDTMPAGPPPWPEHGSSALVAGTTGGSERKRTAPEDRVTVLCPACRAVNVASASEPSFKCGSCGVTWRALRCPDCRKVTFSSRPAWTCAGCGHDQVLPHSLPDERRGPAWLFEPERLSIWLSGIHYLGGHSGLSGPVRNAALLFDTRGIHVRTFADIYVLRWPAARGVRIEGSIEAADRLTLTRLLAMGATAHAPQVSYMTVLADGGDLIFEVSHRNPPELRAMLARVIHGLDAPHPAQPSTPEARPASGASSPSPRDPVPEPERVAAVAVREAEPEPAALDAVPEPEPPTPAPAPAPTLGLQFVADELRKLADLRDDGILTDSELTLEKQRLLRR